MKQPRISLSRLAAPTSKAVLLKDVSTPMYVTRSRCRYAIQAVKKLHKQNPYYPSEQTCVICDKTVSYCSRLVGKPFCCLFF